MQRTRIKICGITRLADALAAEKMGADAIGFNFHKPSKRFVDPAIAARMAASLSPFVSRVGVFVDLPEREVTEIINTVGIDCLQFHGVEPAAYCESFGLPYIKALKTDLTGVIAEAAAQYQSAALLLLDSVSGDQFGGTGQVFDWKTIPDLPRPFLLAGGLSSDNVGSAIFQARPFGVDVSGGVETGPGLKDEFRLAAFFESVRTADARKQVEG